MVKRDLEKDGGKWYDEPAYKREDGRGPGLRTGQEYWKQMTGERFYENRED